MVLFDLNMVKAGLKGYLWSLRGAGLEQGGRLVAEKGVNIGFINLNKLIRDP